MPELPDIEVFCFNLNKLFVGRKVEKVQVVRGHKMPVTQQELKILEGTTLKDIYRSGKEMRFKFSNGSLMGLHLMLSGDVFLFNDKNEKKQTVVEFYFSGGKAFALVDRMLNAHVKLNFDDKKGIEALDIDYKYLKSILNKPTKIKKVLIDQDLIRGIGGGYSDEILYETGISPYSSANAIPDDKIKELATNIKKVLKDATKKIAKAYPDLTHGEVRDFMKVHTKQRTETPKGEKIIFDQHGGTKTYYTDEQVVYK